MTNEQLAEFIQQGGNDELAPILWERVRKLLYKIAVKYYSGHSEMCAKCGVTEWDLKQQAYSAYLGAVRAYSREKGYQFTSYLELQFKAATRPLFGKDLLNSAERLNDGLFEVKECMNEKTTWSGTQTLITPKGRETFRLLQLN